jgi:flagellar motility protein MotE (MotC chaperone)
MSGLLPPSRLLAATIVVTAVALAIKTVTLVTFAPSLSVLWAGTTHALEIASATRVIRQAQAAQTPAAPIQAAAPELPTSAIPHASSPDTPPPSLPATSAQPAPPPLAEVQPGPTTATGDTTQEVKLRRSQIDEREQRLTEREAALAATDKHLTDRVAELLVIQARLEGLENERKAHDEANWTGLVKLYEGMRPRDAAAIFNALDKPVLLEIVDRMKPAKASPVIALMEPESARQITADLAAKRIRSTTVTN